MHAYIYTYIYVCPPLPLHPAAFGKRTPGGKGGAEIYIFIYLYTDIDIDIDIDR